MSLALLFHYLMLNMFRMLIHPSSELATYLLSYFMARIALVRCVLVNEITQQISRELLRMGVLTSETC